MDAMTGGAKLEDFLRRTAKKVRNAATLKVGFMEDATYPDGRSVAMVSALNNFGAPAKGIPPRPFFSNMIRKHQGEWPGQVASALKYYDMDARKALKLMGHRIAGELREEIVTTTEPPNSPVTNLLKQRFPLGNQTPADVWKAMADVAAGKTNSPAGKPLIWSGHMLQSVEFEVADDRYAFDEDVQSFALKQEG